MASIKNDCIFTMQIPLFVDPFLRRTFSHTPRAPPFTHSVDTFAHMHTHSHTRKFLSADQFLFSATNFFSRFSHSWLNKNTSRREKKKGKCTQKGSLHQITKHTRCAMHIVCCWTYFVDEGTNMFVRKISSNNDALTGCACVKKTAWF